MWRIAGQLCRLSCVVVPVLLATGPWFPALSADEAPAGASYALFDGQTLNGWTAENGCEVVPQEGALLLKAGDGWLRSDHTYGDFEMHVEWKALQQQAYDAGIFIRTAAEGKPFPKHGYQINLLQGKEGNIGNLPGASSSGLARPAGEWNAFDIRVVGDQVTLDINGKRAYQVSGLKAATGYVGFQVEVPLGGQFLLRNIRITELGAKSLFNGKDFANWVGTGLPAEECWTVEDGVLLCTGKKGSWLRSREEYGDFNLRLEYQVADGANSGVYVRVPADGNHHRQNETEPPAGFEVQIIDDAHEKHRDIKDYQYTASIYDIAGATRHVAKPAGQWNTLEINCLGQHVTITHNGAIVVDADEEHFPLLKLRNTKGYLGLQNHFTPVKFKNIRVAPAMRVSGSN